MNELEKINETIFESIKHVDEDGNEYWYARELQKVLEYKRWDKFYNVIESAQVACSISNYNVLDHFSQVGNKVAQQHMGSTELAANLFRATQTEEKLRRDMVSGKQRANQTHYEVGKKVRQTIADLGGTMPEALPTPEASVKQLETSKKTLEKKQ